MLHMECYTPHSTGDSSEFEGAIELPGTTVQTGSGCEASPRKNKDETLSLGYICVHHCTVV